MKGEKNETAFIANGGGDPFPIAPPAPLGDAILEMNEKNGVLFVSGDVDLYQAGQFRKASETYIASSSAPRIDITGVAFIDSAGLAALLMLSRGAKADDKTLTVIASGAPRRVLRITGIDQAVVVEG